jgi:hypothetical protein
MKKSLIVSIGLTTLLFSCGQKKERTKDAEMGKKVLENISFQVEHIPAEFQVEQIESTEKSLLVETAIDKQTLDLPTDFINRNFLTNSVGFKDKLDYLVGMVVKKEKINDIDIYLVVRDFKIDSVKVSARIPAQGILIEKKYDQKMGAGIKYLISSAEIEKNSAFQILIADVSEILIDDKSLDKLALYNTYNNDTDIEKYFIVRAAVTTSILYKKYTKMSAKTEFNAAAIKVNGNYYSESSDFKQDWKIGMQLTPVKEFLKGFKPPKNQSNP